MTKAIIFDLGGVLIDLDLKGMEQRLYQLGLQTPPMDLHERYQVGTISTEDFVETMLTYCPAETDKQTLIDAWNSCLLHIPQDRLEAIITLRQQGYHTYLLSNTNALHWQHVIDEHLAKAGYTPRQLFDEVFVSQEVHLAKPDVAIYHYVLDKIKLAAEECLFIDDSNENTSAANQVGLPSLWLDLSKEDVIGLLRRKQLL